MKDKLTFEQECKLIANGEDLPKAKAIEEMASKLNELFIPCIGYTNDFMRLEIAQELLKYYQPKLPEDSVVLTREEYSDYLILQKNHEFIREKAKELQADNERLYKNIGKFKELTVKETAEKILKEVKDLFINTNYNIDWIFNKLEEIANREGVEIKENKDENN